MSSNIVLYSSSTSGSQVIKKQQMKIKHILETKKIDYKEEDIASDSDLKAKMRELIGDKKALPPQIFNGDVYCGNYQAFEEAVEDDNVEEFLKLK